MENGMDMAEIDRRVEELLDRMTLEEMILQTDQYGSGDFTKRETGENGEKTVALDMEKLDSLLKGNSVGSLQTRHLTPAMINTLQRYAVEKTRLGIPFLFSEEAFGEGQELLITVTELTANYNSARFISEFGCDEYFRHNKELLFYERQREIITKMENLGL